LDWRPAATLMTLGEVLHHVAESVMPVVEIAVTDEIDPRWREMEVLPSADVPTALAVIDAHKARLSELLAGVTEEQWRDRQVTMPWGAQGSLGCMCGAALEHGAGHRYQLFLYLKLLGQPLTTAELYNVPLPE
jgi:uncharacterized damage-inducible protein DinB